MPSRCSARAASTSVEAASPTKGRSNRSCARYLDEVDNEVFQTGQQQEKDVFRGGPLTIRIRGEGPDGRRLAQDRRDC